MPLYDYDCAACGRRFEVVHGVHADGPTACPLCGGGPVRKAFAPPAIHFKGSGWAKKERRSASSGRKASGDADATTSTGSDQAGTDGGAASTTSGTSSAGSGSTTSSAGSTGGAAAGGD